MEVDILRQHRINATIFLCVACLILGMVCDPKQVNAKEADVAKNVITATDSTSKEILSQVGLFSSFSNANILMFNQVLKEQQLNLKEQQLSLKEQQLSLKEQQLSLKEQQDKLKKEEKEQEAKKQEEVKKGWTHEFHVTAYCGCYSCSEGYGTQTSTGVTAEAGRTIAVDPDVVPYGSKVQINGHTYVAEDCGGAINGYEIDIYMDEHSSTDRFGSQYIVCTVYTK